MGMLKMSSSLLLSHANSLIFYLILILRFTYFHTCPHYLFASTLPLPILFHNSTSYTT